MLVVGSSTDVNVIPLLNTSFPILIDIEGSGLPPVDTHVHVFVVPEVTVDGPVSVG